MIRRVLALAIAPLSLTLLVGLAPTAQAATAKPSPISGVVAKPGPAAGQITITWKSAGKNTDHFRVETSTTNFNPSKSSSLPAKGRNYAVWSVSKNARSLTLTRSKLAAIGAPLESGYHVYFRITPYNHGSSGWKAGSGAHTYSMYPKALAPTGQGSAIRVASFNITSAPVTLGTSRAWPTRARKVAQTIIDKDPGIVALQELSPGAYTGKSGDPRQTEDLMLKLRALGGAKYAMVRTTSYVKPGTSMGSQGSRIVYDTTKYELVTECPEQTGNSNWNSSCSVVLPALAGESGGKRRSGAVAQLRDLATGQEFWVASVHLDNRDGAKYEALRATQVNTALNAVASQNVDDDPVIVAGDFNAWQNNTKGDNAPHTTLVRQGYYDMSAAQTKTNMKYSTMNHFDTTLKASSSVNGSRLDAILAKGMSGSSRFENVMAVKDSARASDHNMIVADFRLP